MKVKIGNYKSWIGPYQIIDWLKPLMSEKQHDDWFYESKWFGNVVDKVTPFFLWIEEKRTRNISIKLDRWDTWSMDHTLALIVVPMLEALKEAKAGSPLVSDDDVPDEIKSTSAPATANEWDTDDNFHKRWEYVLDEMIFAFTEHRDETWEEQYHTGKHDIRWEEIDELDDDGNKLSKMVIGQDDTHVFDKVGHAIHAERIQNGFALFGKYYQSLWT